MTDLTFKEASRINKERCQRWHPGFPDDDTWTGSDWSNALAGEIGELAEAVESLTYMVKINKASGKLANIIKKIRRIETGTPLGPDDPSEEVLKQMAADEMGDVFAYLDLLATFYGINLVKAIADKFNKVSERQGFPERMYHE